MSNILLYGWTKVWTSLPANVLVFANMTATNRPEILNTFLQENDITWGKPVGPTTHGVGWWWEFSNICKASGQVGLAFSGMGTMYARALPCL